MATKYQCVKSCPRLDDGDADGYDCKTTAEATSCTSTIDYNSVSYLGRYCVPDVNDPGNDAAKDAYEDIYENLGLDFVFEIVGDVMRSWAVLLICSFLAVFIAIMFIWVIEKCAKVFAWIAVLGTAVAILGLAIVSFFISNKYKSPDKARIYMAVLGWFLIALLVVYLIVVCCLLKTLKMAIAILEAAADFVTDTLRIVAVPIISFFWTAIWIVVWTGIAICVYSVGDIKKGTGGKIKKVDWDATTRYFWYYNFFALLWWLAMIIAISQFIIIVTCCTWYFSHGGD